MSKPVEIKLEDERLRKLPAALNAAGNDLVRATAMQIAARASLSIQNSARGGMEYHAGGKIDFRSRPKQPPASDTGNLAASIKARMMGNLSAIVEVGAEYGYYLEWGTRDIVERPFLRPAVDAQRKDWEAGLARLFDNV